MNTFVLILELVGTVAFAASGAIIAIRKKMDVFGVAVLALTTAVGGGIIRDVILDVTPPATFRNPIYAMTAIVVSIIIFLRPVRHYLTGNHAVYQRTMLVMDALGLGIFSVVGVSMAYAAQPDAGAFLAVFVGVLTGVGGGVMRDVMAGDMPYIFVKHIYACASLAGALLCALTWHALGQVYAMVAGAVTVVIIRILSATFKWNLPKAD
ncbi:MAG: TRIC cation channel family protein [Clostridia bacterium]|nr:TRIC cation channel family protein [Clostridia bacterium]